MTVGVVATLAFAAAFLAIFAVNLVMGDLRQRALRDRRERTDEELRARQRERAKESSLVANPQARDLARMAGEAQRDVEKQGVHDRLRAVVEQAGMDTSVARLAGISAALGAVPGVLAWAVLRDPVWTALAVGAGAAVPTLVVRSKRAQRLGRMRAQLPDAFDLMSRALRAGQTMSQAMHTVAHEFPAPIAAEFAYCYEQQNLGLAPDVALRDLARRTGLIELKIFVLALVVQRQSGGNLAELLDNLATIVRDRYRIHGKIKALTAEGRFQAAILLGLPVLVYAAMLVVNRPYALQLLDHPYLIYATLASMGVGALWIRSIINFDY